MSEIYRSFKNRKILLQCLNPKEAFKSQTANFKILEISSDANEIEHLSHNRQNNAKTMSRINASQVRKRRKGFFGKTELLPHRFRVVEGKRKISTEYRCIYCQDQILPDRRSLSDHITRTHPFHCKSCKISFQEKMEQSIHGIYEHESEQHACTVCNKVFSNKRTYEMHCRSKMHEVLLDGQWRTLETLLRDVFHLSVPARENLSHLDVMSCLRLVLSKPGVNPVWHESPIFKQMVQILCSAVPPTHEEPKTVSASISIQTDEQEILNGGCSKTPRVSASQKVQEESAVDNGPTKPVAIVYLLQGKTVPLPEDKIFVPQNGEKMAVMACDSYLCANEAMICNWNIQQNEDTTLMFLQADQPKNGEIGDISFDWKDYVSDRVCSFPTTMKTPQLINTPINSVFNSPFSITTSSSPHKLAMARQNALWYNRCSGIMSDRHHKEFEELWQKTASDDSLIFY